MKTRERIALAIAELHGPDCCLSAHNYLALKLAKICPEEIELNRKGQSSDPKAAAALRFAVEVAQDRSDVNGKDNCGDTHAWLQRSGDRRDRRRCRGKLVHEMPSEVAQTEIDVPWCATESPPRKPPRGVSHPRSSRFREPGT